MCRRALWCDEGVRAVPVPLLLLLSACSAGTSEPVPQDSAAAGGFAPSTGHGNPEDVLRALESRGVECEDSEPLTGVDAESALSCRIDGEGVDVLHFLSVEQRAAYEARRAFEGLASVVTDAWAVGTLSSKTARTVGTAMGVPVLGA